MPASVVYSHIRHLLSRSVDAKVDDSTVERLALLVTGMIGAKSASPAGISQALRTMGLSGAKAEGIERRIRRLENDPEVTAALCFHPFVRQRLLFGGPQELLLILDPTTQDERLVLLTAAIWYRGRALPIAWAAWPNNTPLKGPGFWARVAALLDLIAGFLPVGVPVTWLADRAFGNRKFVDLIVLHHWHYVVRIQGRVVCRDRQGVKHKAAELVSLPGQRAKMRGVVFKQYRRSASIVVHWGRSHAKPLCIMSDLPPRWYLIHLYRCRYAIEATFRDYKSHGWLWEQGQVSDQDHIERLLIGMALALWLAAFAGTQAAAASLQQPSGRRLTVPHAGKYSLFTLGIHLIHDTLFGDWQVQLECTLTDWTAPNWRIHARTHHALAVIYGQRNSR